MCAAGLPTGLWADLQRARQPLPASPAAARKHYHYYYYIIFTVIL